MAALYHVDETEHDQQNRVLGVKDFSFTYEGASSPVIRGADFTLKRGQVSLVLGKNGSGKTTLLRNLKPILAPQGEKQGDISFCGKDFGALTAEEAVGDIGFLFQNPDGQIIMETVYEELAFGLENLGFSAEEIHAVISDTVSFCGIEHLLAAKTADLSGGQRQLVNLCALLCLRPKLLLLDEPFSQLDPENARRIIEILERLRRETGVAILLSEQRLEGVWDFADQVIYLEEGQTSFVGDPREFTAYALERGYIFALPAVSEIFARSGKELYHLPLSVSEGQALIAAWGREEKKQEQNAPSPVQDPLGKEMFRGKEVSFAYSGEKKILLKQISLSLHQGELLVVCGSNGAGKTTLLKTMAGLIRPLQGKWVLAEQGGGISYLAQTCQYHFRYDTPHQEFLAIDKDYQAKKDFMDMVKALGVDPFLDEDIYTLSAGQQQRLALVMTLAKEAAVYLLDEPTRGLGGENKRALADILRRKRERGVILATHDLEFAAVVGTIFTTLCHGGLTPLQKGADFFTRRYWQTTVGAKLFPVRARTKGWYNKENIPENWAEE